MEKVPFLRAKSDSVSSTSTTRSFSSLKADTRWLPSPAQQREKIRLRTLLGHCHYRRVILWTLAITSLLGWTIVTRHRDGAASEPWYSFLKKGGHESERKEGEREPLPWLKYAHLDSYFNASLKTIVPLSEHEPEFPFPDGKPRAAPAAVKPGPIPTPTPYVPHPDYESAGYLERHHPVRRCHLDKEQKVPAPDTLAYAGVPQGLADPAIGSYGLLGLRDDVCFDRFARYGPYGLGYDAGEGGTSEGTDTEREGSEAVWARRGGKIDYRGVDWGEAQRRCLVANKDRFARLHDLGQEEEQEENGQGAKDGKKKLQRIAVVIRIYVGFEWTQHAVLNFRAMVSELALRSGAEYSVHFLLHVKDDRVPIWADGVAAQRVLDESVPREFHSLVTLWSEAQMRLLYPGDFGEAVENPSGSGIHGVYRSAQMPLQHFAVTHPEYDHFWNWEMDMRYLGNYYELFDRLAAWARAQSRSHLWERSAKYYLPAVHGSWANFSDLVAETTRRAGKRPIMGPVFFPGRQPIRAEERGESFLPPDTCGGGGGDGVEAVRYDDGCGRGEEADLITLNPIFDAEASGWVFASDVTGYDRAWPTPPRRCAIVTASRLSRRLLEVMHEETWRLRHSMFSEMFPAAMALHHGLKAAYAPHPVFLDRGWDMAHADAAFNGGYDASTSGHGSPFDFGNEHNHKGTTWYYNSEFAGLLWRRWLGYAQPDGRGEDGGRAGEGTVRGGRAEEEAPGSLGRLCLRSMLVHPIKFEKPRD